MEIQKVANFKVNTSEGIVDLVKDRFKDTFDIIEDFVKPNDLVIGVKDFYVLPNEFNNIVQEIGYKDSSVVHFYDLDAKPKFKVHKIL